MPGGFPTDDLEDKADELKDTDEDCGDTDDHEDTDDDLDDSDGDIEVTTDVAAYSDEVRSLRSMSEVDQHTDGNEQTPTENNDDQHRTIAGTDGAVRSVDGDNTPKIEHPYTLQPVRARDIRARSHAPF